MKMKNTLLATLILFSCSSLYAATAFWCDAKEQGKTQGSDVPGFKALNVKVSKASGSTGDRSMPYSQEPTGLISIESKDVQSGDIISMVFQDTSGREYHVDLFPDGGLRM